MAANATETRSRVFEAFGFWIVTLLICGIAGLASYKFGRDWIGDRLGGDVKPVLTSQTLTNRVNNASQPATAPDATQAADQEPVAAPADSAPAKAVVEVKPTTPTVEDRQDLRLEGKTSGKSDGSKPAASPPSGEDPDAADTPKPGRDDTSPSVDDRGASSPRHRSHEPSVPSASAPATGARYTVRAGSFADRANADRLASKLRAQGYQPFVSRVVRDGREYSRVNVATYSGRDEAMKLRGELKSAGFRADVSAE